MNPDAKFLLKEKWKEFTDQKKEMRKEFTEHDAKWESCISAVETKKDERVDVLESAAAEFEAWKPTIESSVQIMKMEVQKLSKHWDRDVKEKTDQGLFPPPGSAPPPPGSAPPPPGSVPSRPSAGGQADGPNGHRSDSWNRDTGTGR